MSKDRDVSRVTISEREYSNLINMSKWLIRYIKDLNTYTETTGGDVIYKWDGDAVICISMTAKTYYNKKGIEIDE